jgi:PA14 domain
MIPENMLRGVLVGLLTLSLVACGSPQPEAPGTGLRGSYYNQLDLAGPALIQTDPQIDFDWSAGSPRPGIDPETYSVRWSGSLKVPASGEYTFYVTSDDGLRFSLGGVLYLDDWIDHSATERIAKVTLTAGQRVPLVLDFYENGGVGSVKLEWSGPGVERQVVPTANLYPAP